jgi:hypothetical protein
MTELTRLTQDLLFKILADPNKFRDYHFFLDGKDLSDANINEQYQIDLAKVLSLWRIMPFTISFVNIALISASSLIFGYLCYPSLVLTINKEATIQCENMLQPQSNPEYL